jgi:hypothetical protein
MHSRAFLRAATYSGPESPDDPSNNGIIVIQQRPADRHHCIPRSVLREEGYELHAGQTGADGLLACSTLSPQTAVNPMFVAFLLMFVVFVGEGGCLFCLYIC